LIEKEESVRQEKSLCKYRELIKEKTYILEIYRDATLQMMEQMGQKNLPEVHACVNQRQQAITRINKIDGALKDKTLLTPEVQQISCNEMDEDLFVFYKNMKQMLDDISEAEKECLDIAKAERNGLRREILHYRQHRHHTKGYRTGEATPKFIDTRIR
jgi:hypothetical protein